MADEVKVVVSVVAEAARKSIAALADALRALKKTADEATDSRKTVSAARATANALRQQLLAEQQLLEKRKQAHRDAKRLADEQVAAERKRNSDAIAGLRESNAAREAASAKAREDQRQRVKDARDAVTKEIADQRKFVAEVRKAADDRLRALKEENAKRADNAARNRDFQRAAVEGAREDVRREIAATKELVAAVRQEVNDRVDAQRRIRDAAEETHKREVAAKRFRVREVTDERDRQRAEVGVKLETEKKIRDRLRAELEAAPATRRSSLKTALAESEALISSYRRQRREITETFSDQLVAARKSHDDRKAAAADDNKLQRDRVKNVVENGKKEVASAKDVAAKTVQARKDTLQGAKDDLAFRERSVTEIRRQGREQANEQRDLRRQEIAGAKLTAAEAVAASRTKLTAAKDELVTRQRAFTELRAQGRLDVAAAREQGKAAVDATRATNKARITEAANAIRTSQAIVATKRREVLLAEQAARAQERATARANAGFRAQGRQLAIIEQGMRRLRTAVLQLASAYVGLQAIRTFFREGLRFNALIESSKLGIAALITAQADLITQQGELLTGTAALGAAQGLAARQLDKLRVAGIQTAATTEELVVTFQETVGAGLNVGLTLDQIRKFSIQIALAGQAINLPMNQLQQESRSILASTIDRNSRLAKTLNITNAIVNQAKAEGRLFELLNERFAAFNIAAVESVKTWNTLGSTIKDAFAVFSGLATEPLFEGLKAAGQEAVQRIFDFETADIQESFKGLISGLRVVFDEIGDVLAETIGSAVDKAEDLSKWMRENREEVRRTAAAVGTMVKAFLDMVGAIVKGVAEVFSLGRNVNAVIGLARTLQAVFEGITDNVRIIVTLLTAQALLSALGLIIRAGTALRGLTGAAAAIGGAAAGGAAAGGLAGFFGGGVAGAAAGGAGGATLTLGARVASLIPQIRAATIVVVLLAAAYKLMKGNAQAASEEQARLGDALAATKLEAAGYIEEIINLGRELEDVNLKGEAREQVERQLLKTQQALANLGPEYRTLVQSLTGSYKEQREELTKLIQTQTTQANALAQAAQNTELQLNQRKKALLAEKEALTAGLGTSEENIARLVDVNDELEVNARNLAIASIATKTATDNYWDFQEALDAITRTPVEVRPRKREEEAEDLGEPQAVKSAKARLELFRAQIEAEKSKLDAQFDAHLITAEKRIEMRFRLDLMLLNAERQLNEVLEAQALRDIAKARASKEAGTQAGKDRIAQAVDAHNALLMQEKIFDAKEMTLRTEHGAAILQNDREVYKAREELHIAFLRAIGRNLEAAKRETALEGEEVIKDAIQAHGEHMPAAFKEALLKATGPEFRRMLEERRADLPPLVFEALVTVETGEVQKQLDEIDALIKNAEETRNREVEAIRARFAARGKVKGGLSDAEKQEQLDLITAANTRALASVGTLRAELETLKAGLDPTQFAGTIVIIDGLIARIDGMAAATENLNLRLEELKKQARDALEQGLAQFLEGVGDSTRTLKGLFKEMVTSIINDLKRLSAQFLASSILDAIFKTGKQTAATPDFGITGATGGSTQSLVARAFQRRAAGGPGRPAHGVLRGGSYGRDSIPILAMADEYFVKRKATQYYGADFLDAINQMRLPLAWTQEAFSVMRNHWTPRPIRDRRYFAQGGAVISGRSGGARPAVPQTVNHLIGIDENGLIGFLNSRGGRQIVLGHVSSAPRLIANMPRSLKRAR